MTHTCARARTAYTSHCAPWRDKAWMEGFLRAKANDVLDVDMAVAVHLGDPCRATYMAWVWVMVGVWVTVWVWLYSIHRPCRAVPHPYRTTSIPYHIHTIPYLVCSCPVRSVFRRQRSDLLEVGVGRKAGRRIDRGSIRKEC